MIFFVTRIQHMHPSLAVAFPDALAYVTAKREVVAGRCFLHNLSGMIKCKYGSGEFRHIIIIHIIRGFVSHD